MATLSIVFAVGLALSTTLTLSLPHQKNSSPKPGDLQPLYSARIHFIHGRPDPVKADVLVDNLGDSTEKQELKFQTGDPVSKPYPFIGAYGYVSALAFQH